MKLCVESGLGILWEMIAQAVVFCMKSVGNPLFWLGVCKTGGGGKVYPDMICCLSTPIRAYVHSGETFSLISSSSHIPRYFVTGGCLTSFHTVSQSFLALRSNFDLNHQIHHRRRSACELDAELDLLHHIHSFLLEDGVPEDAVQGEND